MYNMPNLGNKETRFQQMAMLGLRPQMRHLIFWSVSFFCKIMDFESLQPLKFTVYASLLKIFLPLCSSLFWEWGGNGMKKNTEVGKSKIDSWLIEIIIVYNDHFLILLNILKTCFQYLHIIPTYGYAKIYLSVPHFKDCFPISAIV